MVMSVIERYVRRNGRCIGWKIGGNVVSDGRTQRAGICLKRLVMKSLMPLNLIFWKCMVDGTKSRLY